MKLKAGFSPWHTKENSFEQDQSSLPLQNCSNKNYSNRENIDKKSQSKKSSKKANLQESQLQPILRSFSKTQNCVTPFCEDSFPLGFRRRVTRSSQKIECQGKEQKSGRKFDDQKWRVLTVTSNDRFKSECAEVKKYQQIASELKSRRSSLRPSPFNIHEKQKPGLQQVSIKNFIIHGHYTDKDSFYQVSKRRDASYVMKQKFATLKKTIQCKENNEQGGTKKVVIVKGNNKESQQENLFKVIKLEREINSHNNKIL